MVVVAVLGVAAVPPGTGPPGVDVRSPGPRSSPDTLEATHLFDVRPTGLVVSFPEPEDPDRPLTVLDARLEERIRSMAGRSSLWRSALHTIREHRFPVLVGSIVQVESRLPALERFQDDRMGAVWLFTDAEGRAAAAAVTVNLPKLVIRNRVLEEDDASLRQMLELHLAHEIYGHLVPVIESRDPTHPCASDPDREAPPADQMQSCVMRRESRVLEDLGYEPRESYVWGYWEDAIQRSSVSENRANPHPGENILRRARDPALQRAICRGASRLPPAACRRALTVAHDIPTPDPHTAGTRLRR